MEQYIQIGNAVPIRLAKVLGESIANLLSEIDKENQLDYQSIAING